MRTCKTLRDYRTEAGLTQQEAADRCGIAKATWSRIETGAHVGAVETWHKIRLAFRIRRQDLPFCYFNRSPKTNNGGRKKRKNISLN